MGAVQLKTLVLRTTRLEKLRRFYYTLGVDFTAEQHGTGPVHFAGVIGGVLLELYPLADESDAMDPTTRLGFGVQGLDDLVLALGWTGAPVVSHPRETKWGKRAIVRDPDGRVVELYEEAAEPAKVEEPAAGEG
jgi:hypothetical protein